MAKNDEKTIPFLRRLLQMMKENEHAMSFVSGDAKKNIPGRFVIHDRALVEAEILPKYFNHASFASLRRQLNYFHFIREGKGRMKGASYYNDAVFVIDDILLLRRRNEPVGATNTEKKAKAKVRQVASSDTDEENQNEGDAKSASTTSSRRKRKKAPASESESTKVSRDDKDSPATIENSSSNAHIISPSESMEDMTTKGKKRDTSAKDEYDEEEESIEGSLASYKNIQTANPNKKPTLVLDLTRPSESDFTTPFYAHGYASFSQLQQQQYQYGNEASCIQPMHSYQHDINHDAGTFAATSIAGSSEHESPHPITPPSQGYTTWEDEMLGCSALLALQNCGPAPSKKPRQVSA